MAPAHMKALVAAAEHTTEVKSVPVPQPAQGEVLIKVTTIDLNPTDWKHAKLMSPPGVIMGCDFLGVVEDANGTDVAAGTKVAGFVHGGKYESVGAFAEYLVSPTSTLTKVDENVADEVAVSIGIGGYTAVQALYNRLELEKPSKEITSLPPLAEDAPQLLVWSGATSVGQYAIQLARVSGYHVITTASPKNHAYLKSLGAAETYDYASPSAPEDIASAHPNLAHALDCISEKGTQSLAARSLGTKGGSVVVLLKPEKEAMALREDVKIVHTLAYSLLGKPFNYGPAEFKAEYVQSENAKLQPFTSGGILRHLLRHGLLKGNKMKRMEGGLEAVPQGMKYMEEGKVSAEKLYYVL